MMVKLDRSGGLTGYFSLLLAVVVGLGAWWLFPRSEQLRLNKQIFTGYYYGFGLGNEGLFGKYYFKVVARGSSCTWEVECLRQGFNNYRAYYPDGTLLAEGKIYVDFSGLPKQPYPDQHHVKNARYYSHKGRLVSRVVNGTGEQLFHFQNGRPRWSLKLKNYKRIEHRMWNSKGQMISHKVY